MPRQPDNPRQGVCTVSRPIEVVTVTGRELGCGSQAVVHLAARSDGRFVAFKCPLRPRDLPFLEREGERASVLVHPNVIRTFGMGRADNRTPQLDGVVSEYVAGLTLAQHLWHRKGRSPGD